MKPDWISPDGTVQLYHGDCLEILPHLPKVDAVVTDPPYGIGEPSGTTSRLRNRNAYATYDDTEANIIKVVLPAVKQSLELSNGRGMITPGCRCLQLYPRARTIGGFYQPAAVGMSPWGFVGLNPILYYGKDPREGKGQTSIATTLTERASTDEHPCAKPIRAMMWMVEKASLENESILDPFMGSGTTGVACVKLGRRFIGIEIERKYFDIAVKRIERAFEDTKLLALAEDKEQQGEMFS